MPPRSPSRQVGERFEERRRRRPDAGSQSQGRTGSGGGSRSCRRRAAGAGIAIPNIFRRRIILEPRLLVFGRILGWFHILAGAIQWQRRFVCRFRLRPAHRHRRQRRSRPERAMQTRKHLHGWRLQHLPVSQYGRSDGFSAGRPNVQTGMPAIGFQWSRMGRNRIPVRDH